jgi:hypothetical protein
MLADNAHSAIWRCVVGVISLLLALQVSPAHAQVPDQAPTVTAPNSGEVESPPPPGTYRLIQIGPQVVVREDDRGRFTMAEEPEEQRTRGQRAMSVLVGVLTVGAALTNARNQRGARFDEYAGAR